MFTEFRGVITEQFVLQQLTSQQQQAFYWNPDTGRMQKLILSFAKDGLAIPLEVESSANVAVPQPPGFITSKMPSRKSVIRTSAAGYESQDWMRNIPLYGILGWVQ
jgi:predicted AAA+ superfamily ATPase